MHSPWLCYILCGMDYKDILEAFQKYGSIESAANALNVTKRKFWSMLKTAQTQTREQIIQETALENTQKTKHGLKIIGEKTTVVYFTDAHNQPGMDLDRFIWLGRYINDVKPEYVVDGGDFDDLPSLCGHESNDTWTGKFKPAFQCDLEAAQEARQALDETINIVTCKHVTLGNHEHRLWRFEDSNPEVHGMMQHAYMGILERYGWNATAYGDYLTIHGVDFTHVPMNGMNRPIGGKNPCVGISRDSIKDVCFGHTHALGLVTNHKLGPHRSVIAFNGGCYMPDNYMPSYALNSQKDFWYGCHTLQIVNGRLHVRESITMKELEERYK